VFVLVRKVTADKVLEGLSAFKVKGKVTKLTINKPGDECEQEADRVAEQVMRMPEPQGY